MTDPIQTAQADVQKAALTVSADLTKVQGAVQADVAKAETFLSKAKATVVKYAPVIGSAAGGYVAGHFKLLSLIPFLHI